MNSGFSRMTVIMRPRVLLVLVIVLGILGASGSGGTLAYFTSSATSTANTFTAGTVTIDVADVNETAATSVAGSIGAGNTTYQPGQTVVGYITPSNAGTLPFDYGLKYTLTNGATSLVTGSIDPTLEVYTSSVANCTLANVTGAGTGLVSIYGPTALSTTPATVLLDSGGVSKRSLAAAASETLCLAVAWANGGAGAENAKQGASASVIFTFDARQQ